MLRPARPKILEKISSWRFGKSLEKQFRTEQLASITLLFVFVITEGTSLLSEHNSKRKQAKACFPKEIMGVKQL
jgi:hypothetical protein